MKVSYYELLGMIKEGNIPQKLEVKLPSVNYSKTYSVFCDGGEFSGYYISEEDLPDENYQSYLADCFLESDMFKGCIVIKNDDFEDIEEIKTTDGYGVFIEDGDTVCISESERFIIDKINSLINNQKKIISILKDKK